MTITEAARLAKIIAADPGSQTAAALNGWRHAVSREALILMDLFDLEHAKAGVKSPQPHSGRPWNNKSASIRTGDTGGRSPEEIRRILRELGHKV